MAKATRKIGFLILVIGSLISGSISDFDTESTTSDINVKLSDSDSWTKIVNPGNRLSNLEQYNNSLYVFGYSGHISKFNASGSVLWEYPLVLSNPSYVIDSNGNLLFLSEISSHEKLSLIKINSSGNLLYSKNISLESSSYETSINLCENNSMIIIARSYQNNDLYVIKLDSDANLLWNKKFSVSSYSSYNFIVSDSNYNLYVPYYNTSLFLAKINGSGEILWQIEFGNPMYSKSLMIDTNDTLYFIGTDYDNTSIFKINSSGFILKELVINDFSTSMGYNWLFGDMIIMTEYYPSTLYCYDANLNYKWNFNLSDYVVPYYNQLVNIARDSQGNIYILQSNRDADISLVKINSTGHHISQIIWGGPDAELLESSVLDSDNNLFFLCHCVYSDTWRRRQEYTVLVKNPINGGVPHKPERDLDLFDFILFSAIGIAGLISLGMLLSILKSHKKIIR